MPFPGSRFRRSICGTGSPLMIVLLRHSAFLRVDDTTYLAILLIWSLYGSPDRVGHTAAKPSYVRRPMRTVSHEDSRSVWIARPASSATRPDGQVCGFAMTPSRVMYVELIILRIWAP